MATLEELKAQNNELAQKVQYWKMTAAQRDDEKLALMKEINELRLKLSRLRNTGGFQAQKLDAALQSASEKALSYLVQASAEITTSMEIAKAYFRDRQELDAQSPRWSSIGGTPSVEKSERVHRVPPMMMGGQSIQPVVSLSRTLLNTSNPRSVSRSPNQNRSLTERAVPMHMLQDVYIPLTRIDVSDLPNQNMETELETNNADDSTQNLGLEDDRLDSDESDGHISEEDEYDTHRLHDVSEEESEIVGIEPVRLLLHIDPRYDRVDNCRDTNQSQLGSERDSPRGSHRENPLEGPSWLLDNVPSGSKNGTTKIRMNLEPDSTTELDTTCQKTPENTELDSSAPVPEFSPTVRRRKRTSSPPPLATPRQHHYSPRPASCRRNSMSGRVLKVLVAKMRLDGSEGESSPPKRARSPLLTFDAPSPNGATDSRVIVSEAQSHLDEVIEPCSRRSRLDSHERRRARISQDMHRANRLSQEHDATRSNSDERRSHLGNDSVASHHRSRPVRPEPRDSAVVRTSSVDRAAVRCGSVDRAAVRSGSHDSTADSRDSDSGGAGDGEVRSRRARKPITYKEKTLKGKMRR